MHATGGDLKAHARMKQDAPRSHALPRCLAHLVRSTSAGAMHGRPPMARSRRQGRILSWQIFRKKRLPVLSTAESFHKTSISKRGMAPAQAQAAKHTASTHSHKAQALKSHKGQHQTVTPARTGRLQTGAVTLCTLIEPLCDTQKVS
jgi:hypothetical protein